MSDVSDASTTGAARQEPDWYCPACGARFMGPGVCSNSHPPTELHLIADDEEPSTDTPAVLEATDSTQLEPSATQTAAAPAPDTSAPQPAAAPAAPMPDEAKPSPLDEAKSLLERATQLLANL